MYPKQIINVIIIRLNVIKYVKVNVIGIQRYKL